MRIAMRVTLATTAVAALLLMGYAPASALGNPSLAANACLSGKIKCVIKKKSCLLGCWAKEAKAGGAVDPACIQKCTDGFDGGAKGPTAACFAKLEAKGGCDHAGDFPTIESKTDVFVNDAVGLLDRAPTNDANGCRAGKLKCLIKYDKCVLGLFAKSAKAGGQNPADKLAKCAAIITGGAKGGGASCFGKLEAKGGCETTNDSATLGAGDDAYIDDLISELVNGELDMNNQRCTGDTSVRCTNAPGGTGGPCTGLGTCEFWFGTNLPLSSGGVPTCVTNQWNGALTGTANQGTGASAGTAKVISRVYSGLGVDNPCPKCVGDDFANDGAKDGTCAGGPRNNLPCDADGSSPNPSFGTMSLDCPPLPGALIGNLPVDLSNTNDGFKAITLSASSPNCRATGVTGLKCACDVCSGDNLTPCQTNADCAFAGGNCGAGAATSASTAPNQCNPPDGAPDGCQPKAGDDPEEGECADGPIDGNCAIDTQKGCTIATQATDCPTPGDSCVVALRECFLDNGLIGGQIKANGSHKAPVNHVSTGTFGSVFCLAPTGSSSVNATAGLPGPGRLQLHGVSTDDGVDPACPAHFTFTGSSPNGVLDTGWTGIAHDNRVANNGKVTVATSGCVGTGPNCVCNYSGPVANAHAVP